MLVPFLGDFGAVTVVGRSLRSVRGDALAWNDPARRVSAAAPCADWTHLDPELGELIDRVLESGRSVLVPVRPCSPRAAGSVEDIVRELPAAASRHPRQESDDRPSRGPRPDLWAPQLGDRMLRPAIQSDGPQPSPRTSPAAPRSPSTTRGSTATSRRTTAGRTNSWRCSPTSSATPWPRSATPSRSFRSRD